MAPASVKAVLKFNQSIQADVMWIKSGENKFPILSVVDEGTKYQAAQLVNGETSDDFIQSLERHWLAHFGPPQRLVTDEGRGWLSIQFEQWSDEQGIHHVVAAGEAHEQLALVERRHAVLRKAVDIFLLDHGVDGAKAIRTALVYIVPQMNNTPSVSGYSPAQWVLGQSPQFPGELLSTHLTPVHLGESFEAELSKRAVAKMAIVQAETDQKLRRALLRKYAGTNVQLSPGQKCYYWRDGQAGSLVKIRWKGPAVVILREDGENGLAKIYWIAHKTQLLRCAPHHVRPDLMREGQSILGSLQTAKDLVKTLKSRGVTRFIDLSTANKRNIDDCDTDEELLEETDVEEPPLSRRRLLHPDAIPRDESGPFMPVAPDEMDSVIYSPSIDPGDEPAPEDHSSGLRAEPAAGTPSAPTLNPSSGHGGGPGLEPPTEHRYPDLEVEVDSTFEPSKEPSPKSPTRPSVAVPGGDLRQLYRPAPAEDFRDHRRRVDLQETSVFGPVRRRPSAAEQPLTDAAPPPHGQGPYPDRKPPDPDDPAESALGALDIDDIDPSALPPHWTVEDGYLVLENRVKDFCKIKAGCLIRHHLLPRKPRFDPRKLSARELDHMPVPLSCLDDIRVTIMRGDAGVRHSTDRLHDLDAPSSQPWTGCTIFQICGDTRKEMGFHAYAVSSAKQVGKKEKVQAQRKMRKDQNKNDINERNLSLSDRLLFEQAKMKELKSFFDCGVWSFQTTKEADPERTLTSRILLKWSKNADGTPRAKARFVVRGYMDADALAGQLDTASPASTRLGRSCLLSISACLGWCGWSADVSTAFLQGMPQERKLWVKLPADAIRLLGGDAETRMFLHKPVYGQLDAPKRWYMEATRRLGTLKWHQHPMDPCLWLLYQPSAVPDAPELCGLLCLHVDDMLGSGNTSSAVYQAAESSIKEAFNFRTWQKDEPFDYCGAKMTRDANGTWHISHQEYLNKITPITIDKSRQTHQPMSEREQTALRGLLGSLQWPAVQSSPLQASTSLLSGEMSTGLSAPHFEANKLLRFAKSNGDVHLSYPPLGDLGKLKLTCMFDAALGVRHDSSSQGGYIVMLTHEDAFNGVESPYYPGLAQLSTPTRGQIQFGG